MNMCTLQWLYAMSYISPLCFFNDAAKFSNGIQVKIDGSCPNLTAANDRNRNGIKVVQEYTQQKNGGTIAS